MSNYCSRLTEQEKRQVVELYLAGESAHRIGPRFGCSYMTIFNYLRSKGIPRNLGHRKYSLRETAFDNAEKIPEAAYWTGFLMADGCVHKTKKGQCWIILGLAAIDKDHMDKFRRFVRTDKPLRHVQHGNNKQHSLIELAISSTTMYYDLQCYGIVQRKSKIAEVKYLQDNRHFWRGLVDGDGQVGLINNKKLRPSPGLTLTGSRKLTEQFAEYIMKICGTSPRITPDHSIWRVRVFGNVAIRLARHLYQDNDICLSRKEKAVKEMFSWTDSRFR